MADSHGSTRNPNLAPECPDDCTNTEYTTCPRCYTATGIGCDHGGLCRECRYEDASTPAHFYRGPRETNHE